MSETFGFPRTNAGQIAEQRQMIEELRACIRIQIKAAEEARQIIEALREELAWYRSQDNKRASDPKT